MPALPAPSVPPAAWYERGLALATAVSMTVLSALALWAVLAGVAMPTLESSIAAPARPAAPVRAAVAETDAEVLASRASGAGPLAEQQTLSP